MLASVNAGYKYPFTNDIGAWQSLNNFIKGGLPKKRRFCRISINDNPVYA